MKVSPGYEGYEHQNKHIDKVCLRNLQTFITRGTFITPSPTLKDVADPILYVAYPELQDSGRACITFAKVPLLWRDQFVVFTRSRSLRRKSLDKEQFDMGFCRYSLYELQLCARTTHSNFALYARDFQL